MPRPLSPLSSNVAFNTTFLTVFALWATQQTLQLSFPDAYGPIVPLVTPFVAFMGNFLPGILQERYNRTVEQKKAQEKARADAETLLTSDYLSRAIGKTIGALAEQFARTEPIDMGMENQAALRAFAATLPAAWETLLEDPDALPSLSHLEGTEATKILSINASKKAFVSRRQWAEILRVLQMPPPSNPPRDPLLGESLLIRLANYIATRFGDSLKKVVTQATNEDEENSATFNGLVIAFLTESKQSLDRIEATTGAPNGIPRNLKRKAKPLKPETKVSRATRKPSGKK